MSSTLGEKEGTFTNIEFRTSRIDKLVPSPGQTVSDWEFITSLMNFAGLTVETNSLESLNKKAYENLDSSLSPVFDNLDKPSNLDGMVNISKPKISSLDNNSNETKFFTGEKLYGDSATERHSDSISLLGSKKYIEVSEGVIEKYNLTKLSEGDVLKKYAIEYGINADDILVTKDALNTFEESEAVQELLGENKNIILVTSAFHMKRAKFLFEKQSLRVIPYKVDYLSTTNPKLHFIDFLPSSSGLQKTEIALREQ